MSLNKNAVSPNYLRRLANDIEEMKMPETAADLRAAAHQIEILEARFLELADVHLQALRNEKKWRSIATTYEIELFPSLSDLEANEQSADKT